MNPITENFYYIDDTDKLNQRIVVSAPTKHPIVWQISKVENTNPLGVQVITGYQDKWNDSTDYIDEDEQKAGDPFAMYANYNRYTVLPEDPDDYSTLRLELSCNDNLIKAGGSYKLITAKAYTAADEDLTEDITQTRWTCYLGGEDITGDLDLITWLLETNATNAKIKFANVRSHFTEILTVRCVATLKDMEITGEVQLEISAL